MDGCGAFVRRASRSDSGGPRRKFEGVRGLVACLRQIHAAVGPGPIATLQQACEVAQRVAAPEDNPTWAPCTQKRSRSGRVRPIYEDGLSERHYLGTCTPNHGGVAYVTSVSRMPYPGLRAFRRSETEVFFGRDGCVNAMVDRLAATRFLAVLGSSGTGKSSLVNAGLLDALELGLMAEAGSRWCIVDFRPQDAPLRNLARRLLETDEPQIAESETDV